MIWDAIGRQCNGKSVGHWPGDARSQDISCHGIDLFITEYFSLNTRTVKDSFIYFKGHTTLQWRDNGSDSVSNHQPHDCLRNRLFRRRSKKTSKFRVTGLCAGNSPVSGDAENVYIWWRHHEVHFYVQETMPMNIAHFTRYIQEKDSDSGSRKFVF